MSRFRTQFLAFELSAFAVLSWQVGLVRAEGVAPDEVLALMNQDRESASLPDLLWNDALARAAEMRLDDMEVNQYFAHESPSGATPWASFERTGYRYRYAGENLAIHFTDAHSEEKAWMESKEHRENILNVRYREAGIAVREIDWKGTRTMLAVVLFGTRVGDATPLSSVGVSSFSQTLSKPEVAGVSEARQSQENGIQFFQSPSETKSDALSTPTNVVAPMVVRGSLFENFWTNILLVMLGVVELSMVMLISRAYFFSASFRKQHYRM